MSSDARLKIIYLIISTRVLFFYFLYDFERPLGYGDAHVNCARGGDIVLSFSDGPTICGHVGTDSI